MKGFIVVAAGVASLLLFSSPSARRTTGRPESAWRPASPPPASTAARTPPATGSAFDLDLRSNGEGSTEALLPLMRSSRQWICSLEKEPACASESSSSRLLP